MSSIDEQSLRDALRRVKYPGFSRDIVSFGLVKEITLAGADASVQMTLTTSEPAVAKQIRDEAQATLEQVPGIGAALARVIYDHLHPGA